MAKSDLLKEAIADAKAVKETALANAKIALQEAFAPRLERMLSTKLTNEIEGEEDMDMAGGEEAGENMNAAAAAETLPGGNDVGDLSIDVDGNGEFDEFDIYSQGGGEVADTAEEPAMSDEEMTAEYNEGMHDEDLNIEAIIRELEGDLESDEMAIEGYDEEDEMGMPMEGYKKLTSSKIGKGSRKLTEDEMMMDDDEMMMGEDDMMMGDDEMPTESIDEIIEAILREEEDDEMMSKEETPMEAMEAELDATEKELTEAYRTVKHLQTVINEVNLLNAKLLYTNKLFRNFELSEAQKMKVIENFDRAGNTREAKLVFATLAESFKRPTKKRVVKESYASRPIATTAPRVETTQVLSEGFELANRWKKLAGLL
jgi:hypothetical protein